MRLAFATQAADDDGDTQAEAANSGFPTPHGAPSFRMPADEKTSPDVLWSTGLQHTKTKKAHIIFVS